MATQPIQFGQGFVKPGINPQHQQPNPVLPSPKPELVIDIYPRGYDSWTGTSAQLIDEGLVPEGFKWPVGRGSRYWEAGGLDFWLRRCRPEGHKGPMSSWLEIDYWYLRRTLTSQGKDGFAAARLHEKRLALAEELWRNTPAYREQWSRYWVAYKDEAFQRLKALIVPHPR